ncbi:MAG: hypothetical protein JWM05_1826 [Acidimicrobiales bacterium]|nr:hypothetical protein [Acidimicrobiales bacterium]
MTGPQQEEQHVDVHIGVTYSAKELDIELEGADAEQLKTQVETAMKAGGVLWLTDRKSRQVGVPVDKIAYIDIGSPDADRRIGFGG